MTADPIQDADLPASPEMGELLCFCVAGEEYAVDIPAVRELLDLDGNTPLPRTPECVRGLVYWQGTIVPVFELGLLLGRTRRENTGRECIVVLDLGGNAGPSIVGCVVDEIPGLASRDARAVTRLDLDELRSVMESALAGSGA